jgi:hypothetical protein
MAMGLLTLAAAGFLFKDAILEAWHLHKLETGYLEEKIAAARRLGELGSARAAPALIEAFRILCVEAGSYSRHKSCEGFQEALQKIGKPALLSLVRAVPRAISMIQNHEDGCPTFYYFVHETIEINYLGKTPLELSGTKTYADLQRILESLRDDALTSPELREAAVETLKAFP